MAGDVQGLGGYGSRYILPSQPCTHRYLLSGDNGLAMLLDEHILHGLFGFVPEISYGSPEQPAQDVVVPMIGLRASQPMYLHIIRDNIPRQTRR
jgi:hypothetical protein